MEVLRVETVKPGAGLRFLAMYAVDSKSRIAVATGHVSWQSKWMSRNTCSELFPFRRRCFTALKVQKEKMDLLPPGHTPTQDQAQEACYDDDATLLAKSQGKADDPSFSEIERQRLL